MLQCTATALLHPPEEVRRLTPPERLLEPGYVTCELGEGHDAAHARMLWADAEDDGALWVRWKEGRATFTELRWCTALSPQDDGCGLFTDHPSAHSWDVTDPTREALVKALELRHPHLFPEPSRPHAP
ncbi:hypothetical protein V1J52_13870 [Streptomyces sp. TRM 70351]|uniref:hypothetical protein n=1 Tax=Streptomyces sp. TRM 70351 TaxID=3116552 RepID=UPI002E7ACCA8|nr:hypothetical protein [Streptomyces sp. TRM 70351]MEE1929252.1 hypothetical protein [Streptomyces sp. TRM 70351]